VCRLIDSVGRDSPNNLRARAVLLLLSTYALRASEVYNLKSTDIDFKENILTIVRSKNRLTQRFNLVPQVRDALTEYIDRGRPKSDCSRFFLTLRKPHGPIQQASLYNITNKRMRRLNIVSVTRGPHALRHACAAHLLISGMAVPKVASLLGHASTRYIGAYIKHSTDDLRVVADFDVRHLYASH
jgi:integrase